jgi:hypothetical protein
MDGGIFGMYELTLCNECNAKQDKKFKVGGGY